MRYDDATIEKVRAANDIVDIVGRYVRLTKKGANYFGLCPFHGEKTASFSVSPRKQIYYCFGCGAGGGVINFLMEYENYSFTEALKALADNAHIELPEQTRNEDKGVKELKSRLLQINKDAAIYYNGVLKSQAGAIGYEYFHDKRKLSNATITHFGLGFSEKASDSLYKHLKSLGYDDGILKESGLVTFTEKGVRDKFWNRVIFPIMDTNNRVIGFGGRVMGDALPKYLNSPETLVFDKSSTLYGLNFAKKSRSKFLLLCEGYMDVIALHQAGFTNAVASLGTALTEKNARLLRRYTDNVILTQDSDKAGISAKLRAFPLLYAEGINVKVLDMGQYKDPDEFIKANGAEAYEECIKKAKNAFIFMIEVLRDSYDLSDPAEKTKFIRETAKELCMFRDNIERDNYIDSVSRQFFIDRDELKSLVDRMADSSSSAVISSARKPVSSEIPEKITVNNPSNGSISDSSVSKYEMQLVSWLSERPDLSSTVFSYLRPEEFQNNVYRQMALKISELKEEFNPAAFLDDSGIDSTECKLAAEAFSEPERTGSIQNMTKDDIEKGLTEAIRSIKTVRIDREMDKCGSDIAKFGTLLKEKNELRNFHVSL